LSSSQASRVTAVQSPDRQAKPPQRPRGWQFVSSAHGTQVAGAPDPQKTAIWHRESQSAPGVPLVAPSSHCSPGSTIPFPQTAPQGGRLVSTVGTVVGATTASAPTSRGRAGSRYVSWFVPAGSAEGAQAEEPPGRGDDGAAKGVAAHPLGRDLLRQEDVQCRRQLDVTPLAVRSAARGIDLRVQLEGAARRHADIAAEAAEVGGAR